MSIGKLAILIGHDEKKQGASAVKPLDMSEYEYNSKVAQVMFRLAKNEGIDAKVFTRNKWGIKGAYDAINEWIGVDEPGVAIELHFNAANKKARGTETLFDMEPPAGIDLAREVHIAMVDCFKRRGKLDRGIKKRESGRGSYNLRECEVPGCIVEPFFGDNPDDSKLGLDLMFEYSAALVKGVARYFSLEEYKEGMN